LELYGLSIKYADLIEMSEWYDDGIYFFIDSNNTLYSIDNNDNMLRYNNKPEIPDSLSLDISCFSVFDRMPLCMYFQEIPTCGHFGIIGTVKEGLHFLETPSFETKKYSDEFIGKTITAIEPNSEIDPNMSFIGTSTGEVFYSYLRLDIKDNIKSDYVYVTPNPVSNKVRLNFTLQNNSNLSIKLYNTLGIELKTIADGYFNEGEDTVPIDVSDLPNGVYLIAIRNDGWTVVEKLVVSR
jgi:hypothetical protein